jgi:Crinkler effector protein N-terminal domain
MDSNTVALFCLLKGQSLSDSFKVKVYGYQDIGDLKKLIKEKLRITLERVDAALLELYQVSIPIEDNTALQEAFNQLGDQEPLNSVDTIDEIFSTPVKKHIHVIVKVPGKLLPLIALPFNPPFFTFGEAGEQFNHFPLYYALAVVHPLEHSS